MNIKLNGWQDFPGPCYDPQARWGDCPATLRDLIMNQRIPVMDRIWAFANCTLVSDRDKRLFAVRCVRETPTQTGVVLDLITDPRSVQAPIVAEGFAFGRASSQELSAARSPAESAAESAERAAWAAAWVAAWAAAWVAASAAERAAWAAASAAARAAWAAADAAQLGFIIEQLSDEKL